MRARRAGQLPRPATRAWGLAVSITILRSVGCWDDNRFPSMLVAEPGLRHRAQAAAARRHHHDATTPGGRATGPPPPTPRTVTAVRGQAGGAGGTGPPRRAAAALGDHRAPVHRPH